MERSSTVIPVVFCSSDEYLQYAVPAIWSVMSVGSADDTYCFYILHRGIDDKRQNEFKSWFSTWQNASMNFIDVSDIVHSYAFDIKEVKDTWLYLLIPECFPQYDKLVALDCDLIVKKDLSALYNTDIRDKILAAVPDPDFAGQFFGGNFKYRRYYRKTVKLDSPEKYFQGGVYLMNLERMRADFGKGELFKCAARRLKYDDQDVLNLMCGADILLLDMRWNVLYDSFGYRIKYIISLAPPHIRERYAESRLDPWIIHYAGGERPWADPSCDFGDEFWKVADDTPIAQFFYGQLEQEGLKGPNRAYSFPRKVFRYIRYMFRKTFCKSVSVRNE